ncbi:MAG TPA: tyrosine-protein phosphatase [Myxococcota bacterium]|nr:tyrosine-protein phosphatase [Myxococcota bacterium]
MRLRTFASAVLAVGILLILLAPGPVHRFFFDENLIEVVPQAVYRSAQPSGPEMDEFITRLGLRSVLNLRGERGGSEWLAEERAVAAARGVEHHTVRLSAKRMPPGQRLREIVRVLDTAPRPLLFHCEGGVERSGLIGAVAVLLDGGDLAAARAQFAPSKGFISWISGSEVPLVLDRYEAWLAARGRAHAPDVFRAWVGDEYHPYFYRAGIAPADAMPPLAAGVDQSLRVRVTNESREPIPFRATPSSGVHVGARLRPAPGADAIELRGEFVDLDLAPGASHEFELRLPPLAPGSWSLEVDLVDEGVKWFEDMGSRPLRIDLEVAPTA